MNEQFYGVVGIRWIVLSARRGEGFAVTSQGGRVSGEKDQEVVLKQREDQWPPALFKSYGHCATAEALLQVGSPLLYCLWSMLDDGELFLAGDGINEAEVMFFVGPIKADESSIFSHKLLHKRKNRDIGTCWL